MASTSTPSSSFLYYPSDDPANQVDEATDPKAEKLKNKPLSKDRLYVGNLHPTVDEYTLLTIFSKYGTIKSMDYLFHKTGPSRGKPRGFAFVEFAEQSSAMSTLSALHDKLLRGRKLVVTFAHQAPPQTAHTGGKKRGTDGTKPTTLSLLKTGRGDGPNAKDKIALLEAKLLQMGSSSTIPTAPVHPASPVPEANDTDMTLDEAPPSISPPPSGPPKIPTPPPAPTPAHPSLPPKPAPPPITSFHQPSHHHYSASASSSSSGNLNANGKRPRPRTALPTLSQLQHTRQPGQAAPGFAASLAGSYTAVPAPALGTPKEPAAAAGVSPAQTSGILLPPGASSSAAASGMTTPRMGAPPPATGKAPVPATTTTTGRPKPVGRGSLAGVKIVKAKKKEKEEATVPS